MGSAKGLWKERPSAHASECCSTTACPAASVLLVWGKLQNLCTGRHPSLSARAQWAGPGASREDGTFWTECVEQEQRSQEDQGADLISHAGLKADNWRESSTWASEVGHRRPQCTPALNLTCSHPHPVGGTVA
uniref:Uncharacterized protein n=1 Tax=Aotus nancymaae TaxID=37293 RepID=A0A2K5C5X8_AOTNA